MRRACPRPRRETTHFESRRPRLVRAPWAVSRLAYKVDDDTFSEAHGFLIDEEDGEPRIAVWKRSKAKVAGNKVATATE